MHFEDNGFLVRASGLVWFLPASTYITKPLVLEECCLYQQVIVGGDDVSWLQLCDYPVKVTGRRVLCSCVNILQEGLPSFILPVRHCLSHDQIIRLKILEHGVLEHTLVGIRYDLIPASQFSLVCGLKPRLPHGASGKTIANYES